MAFVKNIHSVFTDFRAKAGSYVFWASILGKLLTFAASWIALQILPNEELGYAIYAYTLVAFLVPFGGMGVFQSLLRYGARLKDLAEKKALFSYCLKYGLLASVILAFGLVMLADTITFKLPESAEYMKWYALMLFSGFLFELVKVQFRILHNNKAFAFSDIAYSLLLVILVFGGAKLYGVQGYVLAFIISPAIVALIGWSQLSRGKRENKKLELNYREFWWYGIFSSLGNVTTELLIAIDIILVGNLLLNAELVTAYKYITLLPFSLLFLSHVFMSTYYVTLAERMEDKSYIRGFIRNYLWLFAGICVAICVGSYFLGQWFLTILDPSYSIYFEEFMILIIGICGVLLLRGLFGNLISAIGKAQANFGISLVALALNLALNYKLIPELELKGAAITSASIMWLTALFSALVFFMLFRRSGIKDKG